MDRVRLGLVGVGLRGLSLRRYAANMAGLELAAVCDSEPTRLARAEQQLSLDASACFANLDAMLESGRVDAVMIGTPMDLHAAQSIAALQRGIHVLCAVPAGVTIDQCRQLAAAARSGGAIYAMAENYIFFRECLMVEELVARGEIGTPYFADGEYLHELKGLNEQTPWRRRWQTGVNGITYGTHSLGPILRWMAGDRVERVACRGSGRWHRDLRDAVYENEASCVALCAMRSGALAKVRVDMLSDRPHATHNYQLQGTDGAFESARSPQEPHRVWLRSRDGAAERWLDLEEVAAELLPDWYRRHEAVAREAGHNGSDYYEMLHFLECVRGEAEPRVDIDVAMDMTLPGLVSQQSIATDGAWLPVPDSRQW